MTQAVLYDTAQGDVTSDGALEARFGTALGGYVTRVFALNEPLASKQATGQVYADCGEPLPAGFNQGATSASTPITDSSPTPIATEPTQPSSTGADASAPQMDECWQVGQKASIKPEVLYYSGCDGSADYVESISWKSWTPDHAAGVGRFSTLDMSNESLPEAEMPRLKYPVVITVDRPVHLGCGSYFTRVTVHFSGAPPSGYTRTSTTTITPPC